jgi:3-hydroxyisobutyrate dehydrogenase-like beta-hydroxyacid dehydrogenase
MTRQPVIALIAPGEMGAGVGRRLTRGGAKVLTSLAGRSAASAARAQAAGMADAGDADLAACDLILSIVPPGYAVALAERLAPALAAAPLKAVYVDCNAVSPQTVTRIATVIQGAGAAFIDAGIIGGPPRPDGYTPRIYASGAQAPRLAALNAVGLDVRVIDGPVGQASALKMCYAGLNKGLQAIGVSVMLGALEAGVAGPFFAELTDSQGDLLDFFKARTPGIFPKAYRWVAEMEEIGDFLGAGGEMLYDGAARQFERLADDRDGARKDEAALLAFLKDGSAA